MLVFSILYFSGGETGWLMIVPLWGHAKSMLLGLGGRGWGKKVTKCEKGEVGLTEKVNAIVTW